MGFFQKMEQSDVFVILSHAQYEKGGYQSRFNIGDDWYGMSVNRGLEPIECKRYINPEKDWRRLKNRLPQHKEILNCFDDCISESLFKTNTRIIQRITQALDIKTEIQFDYQTDLTATERLVDICNTYGADTYLSGISGKKYLDLSLFEKRGIKVIFQDEATMDKRPILKVLNEGH